ncbi:MAG: transposase [Eubacteriales bacterium]|nr:transposase [Eubacteriales bacterium]
MGDIVPLDEGKIKNQLGEMIQQSVEDTLNSMLDAEANQITNAHRYERTENRADTQAGYYTRKLMINSGSSVQVRRDRLLAAFFLPLVSPYYIRKFLSKFCKCATRFIKWNPKSMVTCFSFGNF